MKPLLIILATAVATIWPVPGHAACFYADGTSAPEPGPSPAARKSKDWGPKFVELFNTLSKGDKSTVVAILQRPGAALLTTKCSNNDLFWTHLSLIGLSGEAPDAVPAALAETGRAFELTEQGSQTLPLLLRADGLQW